MFYRILKQVFVVTFYQVLFASDGNMFPWLTNEDSS